MPELPEAETVRSTLEPLISGKTITHAQVSLPRIVRKQTADDFILRAEGSICLHTERRGKFIIVQLEQGTTKYSLIIHLGMTGAVFCVKDLQDVPEKYRKHIHVKLTLDNDHLFVFSDIRTFGGVRIFNEQEYTLKKYNASILNMGPEVFWNNGKEIFLDLLDKKNHLATKMAILNQNIVAGVGNIYACEVLFEEKIHPLTPVHQLSLAQRSSLFDRIKRTFEFSISVGGSSISDYVDAHGNKGRFQEYFKVYNQKKCQVCQSDIANIKVDGRSSFYCPSCQPLQEKNEQKLE